MAVTALAEAALSLEINVAELITCKFLSPQRRDGRRALYCKTIAHCLLAAAMVLFERKSEIIGV